MWIADSPNTVQSGRKKFRFRQNDPIVNIVWSQLMLTITWAKKSPSKSTYIGPKLIFSTPLGDSSWHALPNLPKLADISA